MSRLTDTHLNTTISMIAQLPLIDWSQIGQIAPTRIPIDSPQPDDPLPAADIVILTWTSAEWSALDYVFLNSPVVRSADDLQKDWWLYSRGADGYKTDLPSEPLWGSFQLVSITDRSGHPWRVLLFKSNAHLAHGPWIDGLSAMIRCILEDTRPRQIYSIGTAGGSLMNERLGDVVITNGAQLDLQLPLNKSDPDNGATFFCRTWFPITTLLEDVQRCLFYPLNRVVTRSVLEDLFKKIQDQPHSEPDLSTLQPDDLINAPINPEHLGNPTVFTMKDMPLTTTDYYLISDGQTTDEYSVLEMDDAVIAREAERAGIPYVFVRNISDTVVPSQTSDGKPISDPIRIQWSGLIYDHFGLFTSYNGALTAWATITGADG